MLYWHKGNPINLQATIDPGANQTIVEIKWLMNGTVIPTTPLQQQITIDTSTLSGEYKISVTAKNACGSVSNEYYETFFITEVNMQKEISVLVNAAIVNATVVMDYTGTVNVTVTDPLNQPIQGATVQIVALNMTAMTDAIGKAVLANVPYSTQTVKITV
jgi:hypothetical protein